MGSRDRKEEKELIDAWSFILKLVVRWCAKCVVSGWVRAIEEHEPVFLLRSDFFYKLTTLDRGEQRRELRMKKITSPFFNVRVEALKAELTYRPDRIGVQGMQGCRLRTWNGAVFHLFFYSLRKREAV